MIDELMQSLGWYKETHSFPMFNTHEIRWHKDGFEIPEKMLEEILMGIKIKS